MGRGADDQAVPLIVVGAAPVLHHVGGVGRRAEERLPEVVHRFGQRIADPQRRPVPRPLQERHVQAVVVRLAGPPVLAVVHVLRDRTAPVVGARRHAGRHVLVDRHQQVLTAQVLVADRQHAAPAERLLDLDIGLRRIGVLQALVHRRDRDERRRRQAIRQDVGKHRRTSLRREDPGHLWLAQLTDVGGVARREQRVGGRPHRHAIEEHAGAAADDEGLRGGRRPDDARPAERRCRYRW